MRYNSYQHTLSSVNLEGSVMNNMKSYLDLSVTKWERYLPTAYYSTQTSTGLVT